MKALSFAKRFQSFSPRVFFIHSRESIWMLNIVPIAPWDFMQKTEGDHNRALGLANSMSKMANVIVLIMARM